jgi:hypothetical protein
MEALVGRTVSFMAESRFGFGAVLRSSQIIWSALFAPATSPHN